MSKNRIFLTFLILCLLTAGFVLITKPVEAGVLQQGYQTPTPNADGQIIYTVKEGDTCSSIYLLFQNKVPIDQIIALNNLDSDCTLYPNQQLVMATVEPRTATPDGPQPTATLGPPTSTPYNGNAEVCVALYEDLDGNQMRSESEFYLAGGVVSINNRAGTYSETIETVGGDPTLVDPVCFQEVPEGDYNLSMGIPEGYIPTTSLNVALEVTAGDTVVIDFAAQPGSAMIEPETTPESGGRSPLLLAIGVLLVAGAAGLAFFFIRSRMKS